VLVLTTGTRWKAAVILALDGIGPIGRLGQASSGVQELVARRLVADDPFVGAGTDTAVALGARLALAAPVSRVRWERDNSSRI
jgi:hypothetical protein